MVAEKELVVKEQYRNKLWAAGLQHIQIDAILEVIFDEADNTTDRIGGKVEDLGNELRPYIVKLIEGEVDLRMSVVEGHLDGLKQHIDKVRKSMPIPKSKYFDEEPMVKPRRRFGRYVLVGVGAMILGPIALSLLASGIKALLGSLLHLLS